MTKQFARYDSYKNSGVEWLGEIPAHWEFTRLGTKFIEQRTKVSDKDYPALSVTKGGVVPQLENAAKTNDGDNRKLVKSGDFVINSRSDRKGSSGISIYDGSVSLINIVLQPLFIDSKYCHYLLKSYNFIEEFYRNGHGIVADLWTTRFDEMRTILLSLPPIEEQQRIADFLDKKIAQINEAIAQKEKMIELLKEYRQVTINNAVTKGLDPNVPMKDSGIEWLGQIPAHWEVKKIKFILKQMSVKVSAKNSNHKYIGMENIESWSGKYIETSIETEGDATQFHENCVLFGKLRPYLAKVFLSGFDGICSSEFMVFDILQAEPRYILNLLLSKNFINIVDSSTYGSKMPRANPDYINNLLVPSPSKKEQKQIADFLDKKMSQFNDAISLKQLEIKKLKEYKTTLIDSAVTGKIKV